MKKLLIPFSSKSLYALEHFNNKNKNLLLCCPDEENAISAYKQLKFYGTNKISNTSNVPYRNYIILQLIHLLPVIFYF